LQAINSIVTWNSAVRNHSGWLQSSALYFAEQDKRNIDANPANYKRRQTITKVEIPPGLITRFRLWLTSITIDDEILFLVKAKRQEVLSDSAISTD
jgi:hypothetical protein